ncbi:MAG: TolC family protein [Gammaproteobacteria bacterium]
MKQHSDAIATHLTLAKTRSSRNSFALKILVFLVSLSPPCPANEPLSLEEAVSIAVTQTDPSVLVHGERVKALKHQSVAAGQLPDPEISFGLANWPIESFDYDQEPMTQIRAGVRQRFPKGRSLSILSERKGTQASAETARGVLRQLEISMATKRAWLELYYLSFAEDVVQESREAVSELVDVVQASFATGLQNNQDLLRAELELSLLDDRALDLKRQIQQQRADLARYIADDANRPVERRLPSWVGMESLGDIDTALVNHPAVAIQDAIIAGSHLNIDLAKEQYKPGVSVDAGYGARGGDRADFASVMVSVQVPLFPDKRQDRVLAASEQEHAAAQHGRDAVLLDLRRQALRAHADIERLNSRVSLYQKVVVNRAEGAAVAALDGYQNQVSDFAELIRSRLSALDTVLKFRRLEADLGQAHARFDFATGRE